MSDDLDSIRKELEEVRKLKEELRREVEDVRREKEDSQRDRTDLRQHREDERESRGPRPPRPPRPVRPLRVPRVPRVPRVARVADFDLDLDGLTDSLETMMDGLGHQIEMSLKNVEGLKIPGIRVRKGHRRTKRRKAQRHEIESIAPERVAKIVAPLGSEERLKLLDYLKTGGKTFNDIENYTGKTGSSLTHHLNPLIEASYVVKGEVRGTYYVTVEGRLAYRLAQWLTHRVEKQREQKGNNGDTDVDIEFTDDTDLETADLEKAEAHLETLAEDLEEAHEEVEGHQEEIEEARESLEEAREAELEAEEGAREALEEAREEAREEEEAEDLDELDWKD
ncbi:MAG: winged helix-turn-helix transcriptional regulator [Candidatus Thorarchaeota archaeon]|nr:winged helix-turn-helix transcriptional regulator [Candidatus Thorarchaeota archaeon]